MSPPINKKNRKNKTPLGELRIIGGKWKRTKLSFPLLEGVRPTPSRIRETLFNWLANDINQSNCLDLFAGSGALGFEALSRGARHVWMIDQATDICNSLIEHTEKLSASNARIMNANAMQPANLGIQENIDIVFCDPPFNQNFLIPLLAQLETLNLTKNALIYVESERNLIELQCPANWQQLKEKTAGDVRYRLFQRQ